ncbi:MAG: PKD domain-containing protein, partial [Candidatus Poseidoniia archaeon]|nr:PKD domain-containing protein [Candidatus Poseidoniia archaeon]
VTATLSGGHHTITLRVVDDDGLESNEDSISLVVYQRPIIYIGNDREVGLNDAVLFNITANDPDGTIVQYEWDFNGDGIYDWSSTTTGQTTFRYEDEGIYTAKARVTDNDGIQSEATVKIAAGTTLPDEGSSIPFIGDGDNSTILLAAVIIGGSIVAAGYMYSKREAVGTTAASKTSTTPKIKPDMTKIECPSCNAQMKVPKLGKMQKVTCDSCGLSGEIEV